MHLLTLLTVFRMVVLPVQFQDRELGTTREQQQALVLQAQEYFNRQFAGTGKTFVFELAQPVTLTHPVAWYGTNYPDRKDIRLADAVREACLLLKDQVENPDVPVIRLRVETRIVERESVCDISEHVPFERTGVETVVG